MEMQMPAIRYKQGKRTMYVTAGSPQGMVKFIESPRLYDPRRPQEPGNRPLDKGHLRGIVQYLNDEPDYIIGAVTLYTRKGVIRFKEHDEHDGGAIVIGDLFVPVDARFHIGDGQHRLRAYEQVLSDHGQDEHDPILVNLRNSGTPAIIVEEDEPAKTAQDFVDLQRNSKPLASALGAALDRRFKVNQLALELAKSLKLFEHEGTAGERIEFLSQTVSKFSPKLYTFASWRYGVGTALIGFSQRSRRGWEQATDAALEGKYDEKLKLLRDLFDQAAQQLPGWSEVLPDKLPVSSFRERYVLGSAAGLTALAGALYGVLSQGGDWRDAVRRAGTVDWLKAPGDGQGPVFFEGTIVQEGRVINSRPAFEAAAEKLLQKITTAKVA